MVAHHSLTTAHEALEAGPSSLNMRLLLMRYLISEIANVADLAAISSGLYKDHPDLGDLQRPIGKALEFFKYLRNVYVGHFVPDLTDKTFEWMPQTNAILGSAVPNEQLAVSWFAFETAINTYADPETGHKICDTDTDLNYPPDYTRFLNFLGQTVIGAITYLAQLIVSARSHIDVPDINENMLELARVAGQTEFSILTKGKR